MQNELKVLYVVGEGSTHENMELRWSLRSLDKHCPGAVPVIVGTAPSWFKGESLPCEDESPRKEKNIMRKVLAAIEARLVEGEFQISADDHFWIADTDLSKLPIYFREPILPDYTGEGNNYAKAMSGTRNVLLHAGYPALNTTCHCNAWCHAYYYPTVQRLMGMAQNYRFAAEYGLVTWAVWPNVCIDHHWHEIAQRHDLKYRGEKPFEAWMFDCDDMFSINDLAFECTEFMNYMEANFSGKSRWEK